MISKAPAGMQDTVLYQPLGKLTRREIEAAIRLAKARAKLRDPFWLYDRAIAATSCGIVIADATSPHRPIIYCNPAFQSLTGYTSKDVLGHNCKFLQGPETNPDTIAQIRQALQQGTECQVVIQNYRKDGTTFWNELKISPVHDEQGHLIHFIGIQTDITERLQAEIALRNSETLLREKTIHLERTLAELKQAQTQLIQGEKMSSLGQLVAGVAHEINNPVSFVYGNLQYIQQYTQTLLETVQIYRQHCTELPPEIQTELDNRDLSFIIQDLPKALSSVRVGAERIREIVGSLRNFSRLDEAEFKFADIHDGIDSTLVILSNRLKASTDSPAIAIVKQYADLPLVQCYPGQLNQVFMNILSNAIDAVEDHFRQVDKTATPPTIRITTEILNHHWIRIRIADNGAGIPPEVQQQMFDPFFTTKPVGKGTGLGLAISYQIVVGRHHGQLCCKSYLGQGTEFIITIPMTQPDAEITEGESGILFCNPQN
jgi:PAS domain S-box-containing protein